LIFHVYFIHLVSNYSYVAAIVLSFYGMKWPFMCADVLLKTTHSVCVLQSVSLH